MRRHEPVNAPLRQFAGFSRRALALAVVCMGCGGLAPVYAQTGASSDTRFPDVVAAKVRMAADGRFDFDVTVSSPYDTPQRYADGFRVLAPSGKVLGERTLWHDHQDEQPFTRDLYGVAIAPGIARVRIQARDRKHGYGGKAIELALPQRP
jgi:hypothetical protein